MSIPIPNKDDDDEIDDIILPIESKNPLEIFESLSRHENQDVVYVLQVILQHNFNDILFPTAWHLRIHSALFRQCGFWIELILLLKILDFRWNMPRISNI